MFAHGGPPLLWSAPNLPEVSGNPDSLLFAVEDFRDAAVVKAGLSSDVSRRESGLAGSLEALAALGAGFVSLLLGALKGGLEAAHLGAGLLLVGGVRDCGSLRAVAAAARSKPLNQQGRTQNATRM